jgi:predicted nucleic acid-binding protein
MILVADCSALVALASCDGLHLLEALFGTVIVPEAVYREAVIDDKPEAQQLKGYLKDKIRKIDFGNLVLLDGFSDLGETEAMILYKQYSADRLLIDDKRGRRVAKINHINTIGSLGVLLAAKQSHLIDRVAPYLDKLAASDIYITTDLIVTVMEIAGEECPH